MNILGYPGDAGRQNSHTSPFCTYFACLGENDQLKNS